MTLGDKQRFFGRCVSKLLVWLLANKYEFTFGDASRSDEQAVINALGSKGRTELVKFLRTSPLFLDLALAIENNVGNGILKTLHEQKLAIDLNLFINGVFLTGAESYRPAGEYWESLDPLCIWGGRFGDADHFSITHEGRK